MILPCTHARVKLLMKLLVKLLMKLLVKLLMKLHAAAAAAHTGAIFPAVGRVQADGLRQAPLLQA